MKLTVRHVLMLALIICAAPTLSTARSTGITGQYQNGCGGGGCHGGAASNNTTLTLTGPNTVKAGEAGNYTFRVAHGNQQAAGMNIAFLAPAGGPTGTLTAGAGAQVNGSQVTHTAAKDFDGNNGADFTFSWTAPAAHGIYTFAGAGNAVDDNGNNNGDVWNTMNRQITVTGGTITAPEGGSYCQGAQITIKWTHTGMTNLRIEMSPDNFTTTTVIGNTVTAADGQLIYTIPANQAPATTYIIRILDARNGDELDRSNGFAIAGSPNILTQPENTAVCVGRTLQLTVGATGSAPVYQWRKNGQNIAGATTGVFRITAATLADAADYDCVITSCNQTVTSTAAKVTVNVPPSITTHPVGADVCEGERVELTVDAEGSGLTYQWLRNGVPISGADSRIYTLPAVSLGQVGEYRCRITGICSPQLTTDSAVVNILTTPTIATQPKGADLTAGDKLELSVDADGIALEYQWYKNGTAIDGATSASYSIASVVRADSGAYSVRIKNKCDSVESTRAAVTVKPAVGPGVFVLGVDAVRLGDIAMCAVVDTTVTGLLKNEGGTPVTVTGAVADPSGVVEVVGVVFPLNVDAGSSVPVTLRITAQGEGPLSASVTFSEAGGDEVLTVTANGIPVAGSTPDTLKFPDATSGEVRCTETISVACNEYVITAIEFTGDGAADYSIDGQVNTPITILNGSTLPLCVRTLNPGTTPATMVVTTTAGTFSTALVREVVSSVDESDPAVITGLTVAPNPMRDDVLFSTPSASALRIRMYNVMGSMVASVEGVGQIRWDGRDATGTKLAPGLYVAVIEQGYRTQVVKLILE